MVKFRIAFIFLAWIVFVYNIKGSSGLENKIYLNKWAVEVQGGHHVASRIAAQHGFRNLGSVSHKAFVYILYD